MAEVLPLPQAASPNTMDAARASPASRLKIPCCFIVFPPLDLSDVVCVGRPVTPAVPRRRLSVRVCPGELWPGPAAL